MGMALPGCCRRWGFHVTESMAEPCILRPMVCADLERVLSWRNHPDVRRFMYARGLISGEQHQRWFEEASDNPGKRLLIFESSHGPAGLVNFSVARSSGSAAVLSLGGIADWGFYAAPAAPKGTGRRLGAAALDFAFEQLCLHKVCGEALATNARSIRLHESLGFRSEGIRRDQYHDGDNYQNVACFGILKDEWLTTRVD
jgi:UDP-4-amino-4,6-dideoxy-N-acetyl-beta-L-altrosamine N-acetyltransferase